MPKAKNIKEKLSAAFAPGDRYVMWTTMVLLGIGVFSVYSSVTFFAETHGGDPDAFLVRHLVRVGLALGAVLVFSLLDYRWIARLSKPALIASITLLLLVQFIGVGTSGAVRWIDIGPFTFQPSAVAIMALILYVAVLLAQKQPYIKSFSRAFTPILFWVLLTIGLIGIENLSTGAVVFAAVMLMCFVGRVSMLHLGGLGALGGALAFLMLLSSPSRAARVEAYLGMNLFPSTDSTYVQSSQGEGYQAHQAKIAFAMGGLTGVGPGKSAQRNFLPAPYNDFIFAIIAEEYGALGVVTILGAFCVLLFRGFMRIARYAADPLGLFLAVGLTTMIVLYAFVHAGLSCGLFPVTGLPLPLVSYGGTSMVITGAMIGMILNISRHADTP